MNWLLWVYIINGMFLINHEIDSAYWNEWKLFKIKGGITGFLVFHIPVLIFFMYGVVEVYKMSLFGLIVSLIMALTGIFAFCIHTYFIKKGRNEFNVPFSKFILSSTLILSLLQIVLVMF